MDLTPEEIDEVYESRYQENKHGVMVRTDSYGGKSVTIPKCCDSCSHLDGEWSEWSHTSWTFCSKNVFFPVKKGTCMKHSNETPPMGGGE